jgi:hypothetical protein
MHRLGGARPAAGCRGVIDDAEDAAGFQRRTILARQE